MINTDPFIPVLQIKVSEELTDIAWELLHNDKDFLCANQNKPFTPLRLISEDSQKVKTAQRPLRLLFMASSPEDVAPVLAFEKEEALILNATRKSNLELIVEESGSLNGLAERVLANSECFDVVHITGHADIKDGKPVFLLEDDFKQLKLYNRE